MALNNTHNYGTTDEYILERNQSIKKTENVLLYNNRENPRDRDLESHLDSEGRVAIGYGYDLSANLARLRDDLVGRITIVDPTITSETRALQAVYDIMISTNSNATKRTRINAIMHLSSEADATILLNTYIDNIAEPEIIGFLGRQNYPDESKERAAIISYVYRMGNGRNRPDSVYNAIREGNRAEAWFRMRYQSNGQRDNGISNRVIRESDMFGLYETDVAGLTEAEAKNIMRMFTKHRVDITGVEIDPRVSASYTGANSINTQLEPIKTYLKNEFAHYTDEYGNKIAVHIDGDVLVGGGSTSYDYLENTDALKIDTNLASTELNDLIFGEAGDDVIFGGDGNDVIYGGIGNDHIMGGVGNDILYGEDDVDRLYGDEGNDYLYGGKGEDELYGDEGNDFLDGGEGRDQLEGGVGYDTYFADASDTIHDADGSGQVKLDDVKLIGGERDPDKDPEHTYYGSDGKKYYWAGKDLTIDDGLVIKDFKNGDLGIDLITKEEEEPDDWDAANKTSPIIIDLNRDGITTSKEGNRIHFDLNANGFAESTGWINAQDGFLVADLNNNEKIDNGRELFGNNTLLNDGTAAANGFEALKEWDTNGDGLISALDEGWNQLKIWQDKNLNGRTDEGELLTLDQVGIKNIDLNYINQNVTDASGNSHLQIGKVEWQDGTSSEAVPNLHTAMQKNDVLRQKVEAFLASDFGANNRQPCFISAFQ